MPRRARSAGAVDDPVTTDAVAWLVDQQEADGGFELADFPGFETPDAVLAIAQQAQVEPAWSKPLARAAVDAVVSTDGKTPLDQLDDLVEQLVATGSTAHPEEVAARGAQLAEDPRPRDRPARRGRPGIAPGRLRSVRRQRRPGGHPPDRCSPPPATARSRR